VKVVLLVAEGLSDDPVAEMGGRTPLEIAKTPALTRLAKEGQVGTAQFAPHELPLGPDVALLGALGYDPLEFYTGRAPLEALAAGVKQDDLDVAFRCDFVTVADDILVDPTAGRIGPKESKALLEDLRKNLGSRMRLHGGDGYRNLLVVSEPELTDDLDELESVPAERIVGQDVRRYLPKGRGEEVLRGFLEKARALLDGHEINRIRVDLNENPANCLWAWGQGKRPHLPRFTEKRPVRAAAMVSTREFARGLGLAAGLENQKDLVQAIADHEFTAAYVPAKEPLHKKNLKTKVRQIEAFDSGVVAPVLVALEAAGEPWRLVVTTDNPESLARGTALHGRVPFVIRGQGIEPQGAEGFHEKAASRPKLSFEQGWRLMDFFLKK